MYSYIFLSVAIFCDSYTMVNYVHNSFMQPGCKVTYPIIADPNRELIKILNMVDPDEKDSSGHNVPSRALHIIGADKRVNSKTITIISFFFM